MKARAKTLGLPLEESLENGLITIQQIDPAEMAPGEFSSAVRSSVESVMPRAKSMGVTPPDGPNAKQKADYDKMSKMSGAQFDHDFAAHMVADHEKDIAHYKKEAKQTDAAGQYARSQIDVLEKHLQTAKSLKSGETSSR